MIQHKIEQISVISYQTVSRILKSLYVNGFFQKINGGAYRINQDIIFKGFYSNRIGLCFEYYKNNQEYQNKFKQNNILYMHLNI